MTVDTGLEMNRKKFKELLLLIAELSEGDVAFGATKLNKLLFYVDFTAYIARGSSVTNETYQKLPHGPAPKNLLGVLSEMQLTEDIAKATRVHGGYTQKRVVALRSADLSCFDAFEIDLIHRTIHEYSGMTATQISKLSHNFIGWELAAENEDIPYSVALIGDRPLTAAEKAGALKYERKALSLQ